MKKVLFVMFSTLGASCLDTDVNAVAQDSLALAEVMENNGYEVWLQDPYKLRSRQSSWPRKIMHNELHRVHDFDEVVMFCQNGHVRTLYGQGISPITNQPVMREVIDQLSEFTGPLYIPVFDPKPAYRPPLTSDDVLAAGSDAIRPGRGSFDYIVKYADLVDRARIIWPDVNMPGAKVGDIYCNIFDHTHKYLQGTIQKQFNTNAQYISVYTGYNLTPYRKARLAATTAPVAGLVKAGPVRLPKAFGFESVSDKELSNKANMDLLSKSKFQLVYGNPGHTFITPRFYQAAFYGSILLCDCDYSPAAALLRSAGLDSHIISTSQDFIKWTNKSDAELAAAYQLQFSKLIRLFRKRDYTWTVIKNNDWNNRQRIGWTSVSSAPHSVCATS